MSTLAEIRDKVRLLAKVPSTLNVDNNTIDGYINSFYRYDLPAEVELFEFKKNISFCTTPGLEVYGNTAGNFNVNLKDFKDIVVSVKNPAYISGRRIYLTQDQIEFYSMYPQEKLLGSLGTGNGVLTIFALNLYKKILRRSVVIGSLNNAGEPLIITDEPNIDAYGREAETGVLYDQAGVNSGNINYITGIINVTFDTAPANGKDVTYELTTFDTGQPDVVLFFDNKFHLRPVPDKVYEFKIQVEKIPDLLVNDADTPMVLQWSQVIAYGAAIKMLQDFSDVETMQALMPEYSRQLTLITRRTSKIRSKETVRTIYNQKLPVRLWWNNG